MQRLLLAALAACLCGTAGAQDDAGPVEHEALRIGAEVDAIAFHCPRLDGDLSALDAVYGEAGIDPGQVTTRWRYIHELEMAIFERRFRAPGQALPDADQVCAYGTLHYGVNGKTVPGLMVRR